MTNANKPKNDSDAPGYREYPIDDQDELPEETLEEYEARLKKMYQED